MKEPYRDSSPGKHIQELTSSWESLPLTSPFWNLLPEGVVVFDSMYHVRFWNRRMAEISGLSLSYVEGKPIHAVLSAAGLTMPEGMLADVLSGHVCLPITLTCFPDSQRPFPLQISGMPLSDARKTLHGGLLLCLPTENAPASPSRREQLISSFSMAFINRPPEETDALIERALEEIAILQDADRAYLFMLDSRGQTMSNTHEWCRPGIAAQREYLQEVPLFTEFSWMSEKLLRGEPVQYAQVEALPPEAYSLRELLAEQHIRSLLAVPLSFEGGITAFIGLDAVRAEQAWGEEAVSLLLMMGEIMLSAINRRDSIQMLSEMSRQQREVVEMMSDVVLLARVEEDLHLSARPWQWSNTGPEYYRYAQGVPLEHMLETGVHPDDHEVLRRSLHRVVEEGKAVTLEVRIRFDGDSYRWVDLRARPEGGRRPHRQIMVAFSDIHSRKQAEEKLEETLSSLIQANADLQHFAYFAAHQIRGPIINLMELAALLGHEGSAEAAPLLIRHVQTSVQQARATLDDLLAAVTQNIQGRHLLYSEPVDLQQSLGIALQILAPIIAEKQASLSADFAAAGFALGNAALVQSIFVELIANALRFADPARPPMIRIESQLLGARIRISICDNGLGIDMLRHRHRLFKMYQKLDDVRGGKGLGLYMVKAQVAAMGGEIEISSVENLGTSVYIYLNLLN